MRTAAVQKHVALMLGQGYNSGVKMMHSQLPRQKLEQILATVYSGDIVAFLRDLDSYMEDLQQQAVTAGKRPAVVPKTPLIIDLHDAGLGDGYLSIIGTLKRLPPFPAA